MPEEKTKAVKPADAEAGRADASAKAKTGGLAPVPDDAPHILVVDDDTRIRNLLSQFLRKNGFRVTIAADAAGARRRLSAISFDLLVIDVMMPGESGLELTQSLRKTMRVPILMLTALSETENRIDGLEAGVDDYLPKPFDPRELLLRVSAVLRRGSSPAEAKIEQISFGPYIFFIPRRELRKAGESIHLTDKEQEIMAVFAERLGETVPRQDLAGSGDDVGDRTIDVQINRLRRKIEDDPANPLWLQTVRGIGYKLIGD